MARQMKPPEKLETRSLTTRLEPLERYERGMQASALLQQHGQLEEAKKAAASKVKAEIDRVALAMKEAARAARDGHEVRDVQCAWHRDDARALMVLTRTDTGEVVETRPMSTAERQLGLPRIGEAETGS